MTVWRLVMATVVAAALGAAPNARGGSILYVDDDGLDGFACTGAPFRTINDALASAGPGDQIRVCPGVYPEQIVLTTNTSISGETFGSRRPLLQPTTLPVTRSSFDGGNPIAAAIIVDADLVRLSDIDIDLGNLQGGACSPMTVGVYYHNSSGSMSGMRIMNVRVPDRPDCESGVGVFVESGPIDFVLGRPIYGRSRLTLVDPEFTNYQKAGLVARGPRTVVLVRGGSAVGSPAAAGAAVANGFEFGGEARGKIADATSSGHVTATPGKLGAGFLAYHADKVTYRRYVSEGNQIGAFVVGNNARLRRGLIHDEHSDGVVLLGNSNLVAANEIDGGSVSGCFINGNRNLLRGNFITHVPLGIWIINGFGNSFDPTRWGDVPFELRGVFGGLRDLTPATASPFSTRCTGALSCDDGDACTTDLCDAMTGTCSHGVTVCDDANPCTTDYCDSLLGCQATALVNGTPCSDGSVCTTGDACMTGTCVGSLTPAAITCNAGNGNVCDGAEHCNATTGACDPGTPLTCDDANACTTDTCDAILACVYTPVTDGTPCPGGTCTGGVCL